MGIYIAHIIFAVLFIFSVVAGLTYIIATANESGVDETDFVIPGIIAGITAAVAIPFGVFSKGIKDSYNRIKFEKIVSIERNNEVEGHFALGCGYVNSCQYYYFYVDHGANKYKLERLSYKDSYIVENNNMTPCVYEIKEAGKEDIVYNIYVPEGTIVKEFHL